VRKGKRKELRGKGENKETGVRSRETDPSHIHITQAYPGDQRKDNFLLYSVAVPLRWASIKATERERHRSHRKSYRFILKYPVQ